MCWVQRKKFDVPLDADGKKRRASVRAKVSEIQKFLESAESEILEIDAKFDVFKRVLEEKRRVLQEHTKGERKRTMRMTRVKTDVVQEPEEHDSDPETTNYVRSRVPQEDFEKRLAERNSKWRQAMNEGVEVMAYTAASLGPFGRKKAPKRTQVLIGFKNEGATVVWGENFKKPNHQYPITDLCIEYGKPISAMFAGFSERPWNCFTLKVVKKETGKKKKKSSHHAEFMFSSTDRAKLSAAVVTITNAIDAAEGRPQEMTLAKLLWLQAALRADQKKTRLMSMIQDAHLVTLERQSEAASASASESQMSASETDDPEE